MTATDTAMASGSRPAPLGATSILSVAASWAEALRVATWALYIGGAALLLAMPLNQGLLYDAIEPLVLVPNHLLMGTVYTLWFALGLALILWRRNGQPSLTAVDGLLLVVVLNVVYTGKWVLNAAPFPAAEGFYYGGDMAYIAQFGHISDLQIAQLGSYTSFPGLALIGAATHLLTGLTIDQVTVLLQLVHGVALAAILFALLFTIVRSPALAAGGTVVFLFGNVGVSRWGDSFHPTIWGFLFLGMLLLLLARTVFTADRLGEAALLVLLVFAMTAEHFITSLIAVGLVAAAFVAEPRIRSAVSWELVAMCATAVFAWQLFIAKLYFTQLVLTVRDTALIDTLYWLRLAAATHVTGIPRWAQSGMAPSAGPRLPRTRRNGSGNWGASFATCGDCDRCLARSAIAGSTGCCVCWRVPRCSA